MIRLYGHLKGSFRTVSEGLCQAFSALGVLDGYVIPEHQEFSSDPIPGALAPIAVVAGDPLRVVLAHTQGMHREIWLMLAPNSEGIPPQLKRQLQEKWRERKLVDGFLAPSTWAKRVLEKEFPTHPVELCPHGVLSEFSMDQEYREARLKELGGRFLAGHFTSSRLDRKQTKQLVRVWKRLTDRGVLNGSLQIHINPDYYSELQAFLVREGAEKDVSLLIGQNLSSANQATLYQVYSCIIQPSRAEGFGLVPLEAAACGVPTVLTAGTGHLEYVPLPGQVVVPVGAVEEMDDYWGSEAPTVSEEEIERGILRAHREFEELSSAAMGAADGVRDLWRWDAGAVNVVEKWKQKYGPS